MEDHSLIREAERVIRRASLWSVWKPILIAAGIGFVTAVATIGVLYAVWHPDGIGI